jgi:aspartyl-tRNA(Asn)/glutamyl-tRNA(Gln) amidotransferase subunit A
MCFAAIASQTGGSITRPASFCGVAGGKPTFGRVSRRGVVPVSFHLDHVGVMARTAEDMGLMLAAISGDDPRDPGSIPHAPLAFSSRGVTPPRLGVLREFFFSDADPEVATLCDRALDTLAGQGAIIVELPLPDGFDQVHAMHRRLMAAEAADFHRRVYGAGRSGYGPSMTSLLAEGFSLSMAGYQEALAHQRQFASAVARSVSTVDAVLTPATPSAAPPSLATTGDPRFNSPWSHAGVPTVSIPFTLTAAGMPIALQFIGAEWSEAKLLNVAAWCETWMRFSHQPIPA